MKSSALEKNETSVIEKQNDAEIFCFTCAGRNFENCVSSGKYSKCTAQESCMLEVRQRGQVRESFIAQMENFLLIRSGNK